MPNSMLIGTNVLATNVSGNASFVVILLRTSGSVRPNSTADGEIGNDLNLSMIPVWMSSAGPAPVVVAPMRTAVVLPAP
ncbi:MAG: hypothetical protein H7270_07285 [Dermatophilaceae bacterium]|nr:hypothetical protein [Dermatophilaceae bacterium]